MGEIVPVEVRYGNGKLSFAPASGQPIRFSYSPAEIAVGDVNNDGFLDLGVANHDSYEVDILLGHQNQTFTAAADSPVVASIGRNPHTHGFALVDISEDGNLDVITGNNEDNNVSVLLGDGRGRFARAVGSPFNVGPSPYPFGIGDIDRDGHLDLVTPSSGTGPRVGAGRTVTVLRGDGEGSFKEAPGSPVPVAANPYFVTLGALSGSSAPAIAASHNSSDFLSVLLNDGRGMFTAAPNSPYRLGSRAFTVVLSDVNRDNRVDLVAATGSGVSVLLAADQRFTMAPGSPFQAGPGAWNLAIGDLNEDGKVDIATSDFEGETVTILLGR